MGRALVVVSLIVALVAACSSGPTFDREAAIDDVVRANPGALTRSQAECYVDRVASEVGSAALDSSHPPSTDQVPQLVRIQIDCIGVVNLGTTPPDTVTSVAPDTRPDGVTEPQGPGDDPHLDELASACTAGRGSACDRLFDEAPPGSRYEDLASTCGGRTKEASCAAVYPDGAAPGG